MKRRVLLVCNPVAGPSRNRGARMAALREGLRKAGHLVEGRVTRGLGDAERVVEAEAGTVPSSCFPYFPFQPRRAADLGRF